MIKSLYKIFQHWSKNGSVYLYSDPHFGDWESYTFRGLTTNKTKEELDQFQVDNINKVVHKSDTIIFLGDIGDPTLIKKIKGYKVLIIGNHDKGKSVYEDYFDEIYNGCLIISDRIILSHEPIDNCPPFLFNIHGHDHAGSDLLNYGIRKLKEANNMNFSTYLDFLKQFKSNQLNVCAE